MRQTSFQLKPVPPFRLDLTVWVLRRRPHNLMDRWDGRTYRRVLVVQDQPVAVAVTQTGPAESPRLLVEVSHTHTLQDVVATLTPLLDQMLGLNADLVNFYRLAEVDEQLGPLVARFRGFKPPRFPGVFEALVNAIAGQQLSLTLAIHLLNRLTNSYGPVFTGSEEPAHAFPRPKDMADLIPEDFRTLGFSRSKGSAIIGVAHGLTTGDLELEDLARLEASEAVSRLVALKGVGRWSAEYVLLRGLGHWDVFPGDDAGARRYLETWLKLDETLDYEAVRRVLGRWQPYGGLIYFHMLLNGLAAEGHLPQ